MIRFKILPKSEWVRNMGKQWVLTIGIPYWIAWTDIYVIQRDEMLKCWAMKLRFFELILAWPKTPQRWPRRLLYRGFEIWMPVPEIFGLKHRLPNYGKSS